MRKKAITSIVMILVVTVIGISGAFAAKKKENTPEVPLTETGRKLEAQYAGQLEALKAEISGALPSLSEPNKAAYLKAREAEVAAKAAVEAAQKRMGEIGTAKALVGHAKGKWIGGADKGIGAAKAKLEKATTDAEREAAKKELAHWEQNRKDGEQALKERQANLDRALRDQSKIEKDLKDATEALEQSKSSAIAAINGLGLSSFLSSDKLDGKLAKYAVLLEATPRGLAEFAQQGKEQEELVEKMLGAESLLVQMAVADGATGGNYGRAMEIYADIRETSSKAGEGTLQRLALAAALEHAVPRAQRNATAETEAPSMVDPVERFLHFERAFLYGELDPGFKDLSVWDYRMVVNGEEPEEILAWGRKMLHNYRPDHISTNDYRWRYVAAVRSDIRYGSQDNQYDKDELQFFQNILMNGGVCGRRAFFGRFILRSFGIPTTARPQRGHAALAHWTPDGWVVCLGGGWGAGWTKTPYDKDLNFLATTQARATGETYKQVKRAHWIGDVMGEKRTYGLVSGDPAFWNGVALYTQRGIIEDANARTLAAVGEDIGEGNETREKVEIAKVTMTEDDRRITVNDRGVITIPAAATSTPTKSTGKIIFMPSNLGGKQLHYGRNGGPQKFEYLFDAPAAGKYLLTARVVTPSWKQSLLLSANGAREPVEIVIPFTVGMWDETEPITVELVRGKNTLQFSHKSEGYAKGFTIKDFTLTPAFASSAASSAYPLAEHPRFLCAIAPSFSSKIADFPASYCVFSGVLPGCPNGGLASRRSKQGRVIDYTLLSAGGGPRLCHPSGRGITRIRDC